MSQPTTSMPSTTTSIVMEDVKDDVFEPITEADLDLTAVSAFRRRTLGRVMRFLVSIQSADFVRRARREGYSAAEHRAGCSESAGSPPCLEILAQHDLEPVRVEVVPEDHEPSPLVATWALLAGASVPRCAPSTPAATCLRQGRPEGLFTYSAVYSGGAWRSELTWEMGSRRAILRP